MSKPISVDTLRSQITQRLEKLEALVKNPNATKADLQTAINAILARNEDSLDNKIRTLSQTIAPAPFQVRADLTERNVNTKVPPKPLAAPKASATLIAERNGYAARVTAIFQKISPFLNSQISQELDKLEALTAADSNATVDELQQAITILNDTNDNSLLHKISVVTNEVIPFKTLTIVPEKPAPTTPAEPELASLANPKPPIARSFSFFPSDALSLSEAGVSFSKRVAEVRSKIKNILAPRLNPSASSAAEPVSSTAPESTTVSNGNSEASRAPSTTPSDTDSMPDLDDDSSSLTPVAGSVAAAYQAWTNQRQLSANTNSVAIVAAESMSSPTPESSTAATSQVAPENTSATDMRTASAATLTAATDTAPRNTTGHFRTNTGSSTSWTHLYSTKEGTTSIDFNVFHPKASTTVNTGWGNSSFSTEPLVQGSPVLSAGLDPEVAAIVNGNAFSLLSPAQSPAVEVPANGASSPPPSAPRSHSAPLFPYSGNEPSIASEGSLPASDYTMSPLHDEASPSPVEDESLRNPKTVSPTSPFHLNGTMGDHPLVLGGSAALAPEYAISPDAATRDLSVVITDATPSENDALSAYNRQVPRSRPATPDDEKKVASPRDELANVCHYQLESPRSPLEYKYASPRAERSTSVESRQVTFAALPPKAVAPQQVRQIGKLSAKMLGDLQRAASQTPPDFKTIKRIFLNEMSYTEKQALLDRLRITMGQSLNPERKGLEQILFGTDRAKLGTKEHNDFHRAFMTFIK